MISPGTVLRTRSELHQRTPPGRRTLFTFHPNFPRTTVCIITIRLDAASLSNLLPCRVAAVGMISVAVISGSMHKCVRGGAMCGTDLSKYSIKFSTSKKYPVIKVARVLAPEDPNMCDVPSSITCGVSSHKLLLMSCYDPFEVDQAVHLSYSAHTKRTWTWLISAIDTLWETISPMPMRFLRRSVSPFCGVADSRKRSHNQLNGCNVVILFRCHPCLGIPSAAPTYPRDHAHKICDSPS